MSLVTGASSADETAAGEIHPYLSDEFGVQLVIFRPDESLMFRYDRSTSVPGLDINFERDLRLRGERYLLALEFTWRYGTRWSLRGQYLEASNRGARTLSEDITWGDVMIMGGALVFTESSLARSFAAT
jgi:hypothetical protein